LIDQNKTNHSAILPLLNGSRDKDPVDFFLLGLKDWITDQFSPGDQAVVHRMEEVPINGSRGWWINIWTDHTNKDRSLFEVGNARHPKAYNALVFGALIKRPRSEAPSARSELRTPQYPHPTGAGAEVRQAAISGNHADGFTTIIIGSETVQARSKDELMQGLNQLREKGLIRRNFEFFSQNAQGDRTDEIHFLIFIKSVNGGADELILVDWRDADGIAEILNRSPRSGPESIRSEARRANRAVIVAQRVVGFFVGNNGRLVVDNLQGLAGEVKVSVESVGVHEFAGVIRSEARRKLNEIENRVQGEVLVGRDVAERAIQWFLGQLEKRVSESLVIAFDVDGDTTSLVEGLNQPDVQSRIGLALFPKGMREVKIAGLNTQFLPSFTGYRPLFSFKNGEALPLVTNKVTPGLFGLNRSLFGVGLEGEVKEGEPFFEVVTRVAQIVNALLVADRVQKAEELRNPATQEAIRAELLKDLFYQYDPKIVRFDEEGNLLVDRSRLFEFVTQLFQAEATVAKAA
jgi:hypothetical protein